MVFIHIKDSESDRWCSENCWWQWDSELLRRACQHRFTKNVDQFGANELQIVACDC